MNGEFIEDESKYINIGENHIINYIYEGENLKCMNKLKDKLKGKVDIVYIDPPYNTGTTEFRYKDKFEKSQWIELMEARLTVVKDLLNEEGVIFISIDDNEYANLKILCDNILGNTCYVATIIRNTKSQRNASEIIKYNHEYLLVYGDHKKLKGLKRNLIDTKEYCNRDQDENGAWKTSDITVRRGGYKYKIPQLGDTKKSIEKTWKYNEEEFKKLMGFEKDDNYKEIYKNSIEIRSEKRKWYKIGKIIFKKKDSTPYEKLYFTDSEIPYTIWDDIESQKSANKYLNKLLGYDTNMNPKPVEFIKKMLQWYDKKDALILDFFAGSGTTGEATMKLNNQDNGNRRVILINNNEKNICSEILYTRIKKIIENNNYKCSFKYIKVVESSE